MIPADHPNPAIVDRFKERKRQRWLNAQEVTRLAGAINRDEDPLAKAAIRLLLLTGCRRTELLRARWERVDFAGQRMLLEDTKTGEPKVVPLSEPALDILRGLPRDIRSGWVFPSPVDPAEPLRDLKRPWNRIRKRAKLKDTRLHDLRRTTGSWLVQRGVPLKVVGEALSGHADTRATEIYARIAAQQPADALELLGQAFAGVLASKEQRRRKRTGSKA